MVGGRANTFATVECADFAEVRVRLQRLLDRAAESRIGRLNACIYRGG